MECNAQMNKNYMKKTRTVNIILKSILFFINYRKFYLDWFGLLHYSLAFFNVYGALFSVITYKLDLFRERFKKKIRKVET